jgi:phosphate transport system protein
MTLKRHTDREFDAELGRVRDNLLRMTGRVEQMIAESVRAIFEPDVVLARRTIEADHQVNRIEVDTDDLCLMVLAKRQPLGGDLRFITTAMKMVTDIERIGDLAVNIAERGLALDGFRPALFAAPLSAMADLGQAQLRDAIESFVARDPDRAQAVCARDIVAVAKFLERIGDHVTNLAELVIFLVRGQDVRHVGKL